MSIPSSINHNLSSVTPLPFSCSETTHTSILDGSMFSSDDEFYEDNVPARDALPGGLGSGLLNESIQSLGAMIEQQYQESGVTRETRTSLDAESNNSDQSKESDFDNQESQHQFNGTSRPVLYQSHNPSVLPGCCSFKPSVYSGTGINEQATALTSEEIENNERSATESDACSNDKTVLFTTPAYQFDHLRCSQEQPLKVNGIVKGDEAVKDDPSYPTPGGDNPNVTGLTSKQATAIIHEITTQLATQPSSHGPKTNTAGFFHLPSQSFAQALNPGNPSPVPIFYADSYHLASSILFRRLATKTLSVGILTNLGWLRGTPSEIISRLKAIGYFTMMTTIRLLTPDPKTLTRIAIWGVEGHTRGLRSDCCWCVL